MGTLTRDLNLVQRRGQAHLPNRELIIVNPDSRLKAFKGRFIEVPFHLSGREGGLAPAGWDAIFCFLPFVGDKV